MLDIVNAYATGNLGPDDLTVRRLFWNEFRYCRGTEIFGEAEPSDHVYQVKSGAVRTFKLLPDGRRQIGAFHLAGDIFGIESGEAYRFTAEAIVNTRVRIARRERVFCEFPRENILPGEERPETGGQKSSTRRKPCSASRPANRSGEDCVLPDRNGPSPEIAETVDAADEPSRYCRLSRSYP